MLCLVHTVHVITLYVIQKLLISQFHNHAQLLNVNNSSGALDNQTWQTEWKTAPLAKVQLC